VASDAELPILGRTERRAERGRALLAGTGAVLLVGVVDLLTSPAGAARFPLWIGWAACFLTMIPLQRWGPAWLSPASGALAGVWSMLTLLAMSWVSGGSHSIYFLILMMVPLMTALVMSSSTGDPVLQGLIGLVGGGALMRAEGRPWFEVLPWATLAGIATAFALGASIRARRRQEAFVRSQQERASAIEQLAAAEKARAEIEQWAALGRLADRVAHDVNSPLASIRSNLCFLREEAGGGEEVARAVQDGVDCADRIRAIIAGLQSRLRSPPEPGQDRQPGA